ncbi:2110_t:CDS:1, partial [Cetraspora pellucida]
KDSSEVTFNTKEINLFVQEETQNMNTEKTFSQKQTTNIKETFSQEQAIKKNSLMNNMNVETDALFTKASVKDNLDTTQELAINNIDLENMQANKQGNTEDLTFTL